jgi:hypothetical protein
MRKLFVVVIAASLFAACNNNKSSKETTDSGTGTNTTTTTTNATVSGWPDSTRTAFITECVNNSKGKMTEVEARRVCNCMQEKIEARYPTYSDAAALTMQQMNDMAKECVQ